MTYVSHRCEQLRITITYLHVCNQDSCAQLSIHEAFDLDQFIIMKARTMILLLGLTMLGTAYPFQSRWIPPNFGYALECGK